MATCLLVYIPSSIPSKSYSKKVHKVQLYWTASTHFIFHIFCILHKCVCLRKHLSVAVPCLWVTNQSFSFKDPMGFHHREIEGQLLWMDSWLVINSHHTLRLLCKYESILGCDMCLHKSFWDIFTYINLVRIYVTLMLYLTQYMTP